MTGHSKIIYLDPSNLQAYKNNARTHSREQIRQIVASIQEFGFTNPVLVDKNGGIIAGHGRVRAALDLGMETVPTIALENLSETQVRAYILTDNRLAENAGWDEEILSCELKRLSGEGFDLEVLGWEVQELEVLLPELEEVGGGTGDEDEVPEPPPEPISKPGDIWILDDHRLMCGDSTKAGDVGRLMGGEVAELCHADPPYGMGKEKDGVENDNLYRDKLDGFQMEWWKAFRPSLKDNASAYIWGNAPDLWRLWYVGGLADSERLTFRNEIVWNKGHGQGQTAELFRSFPPATERCLFFMIGEQGFNNNADNYWDGWEPIRAYLDGERLRMGWSKPNVEDILGSVNKTQHIFSKSQFNLITETDYKKLQGAAKGDGFKREYDGFKREYDEIKREYDEIKREFYATRAYFDNAHDNMTDVWEYARVQGEERHGHATPKPVDMISRAIKSSCPDGGIVVEPFSGSGTTIIAAEKTGRKCYAMEISPAYVDVGVKRWEEFTGKKAALASG